MNASLAYLFRKRHITHDKKEQEIFTFEDIVMGLSFANTEDNELFHIVTGKSAGILAAQLNEDGNETEYVVILLNMNEAVKANDNRVNFEGIRNNLIKRNGKYYIRSEKSPTSLSRLIDKKLIRICDETFSEKSSDFDEEAFEKTSNISKMYSFIKKTIISQDEQIMQILTTLFKNQTVVKSKLDIDLIAKLKENLLIFGSTGTGKTEILKRISRLYKIPIVIQDATSLSETGYQGRKISDMFNDLMSAAGGDVQLAERGILVIDEFDKLAEKPEDNQSHVSRAGVQRGLLKLLDGSEFYVDGKKFDTSRLTVVALGAFTGIVKDTNTQQIGVGADKERTQVDVDNYKDVTTEDFTNYGIIRELIGRFSKFVKMSPLKEKDIKKILVESDFSPLNTYKKLFELLGIEFSYNDDFVNWLAERAVQLNSGARSLKTVFDESISGAMFKIFAGEYSNVSLVRPESEDGRPYVLTKKGQEKPPEKEKKGFFR
ncbi:MAG: AAA family ATPase [Oscillospiraceae bacterium]|nr:AAA family ATPase [Oscillospiraceae bacterium]